MMEKEGLATGSVMPTAAAGAGDKLNKTLDIGAGDAQADTSEHREAGERDLLVVDDNVDSAESLAMLLDISGYPTRIANDGPAALAAVAERLPYTVILDIGMPGMDGYEVARRLRVNYPSETLQLIGLSGYGDEESRRNMRAAGFDGNLVKPVDVEAIIAILRPKPGA
jgi:CheY-like chemotaxis protein